MGTHLTDTQVKNAKLPEGKTEHTLTDLPGLYLRLRGNRDGSITKAWLYRYKTHGETKRMSLGTYPNMTLADARTELSEQQKILSTGIDPQSAKEAGQAKRQADYLVAKLGARPETLNDLFNLFVDRYAKLTHSDKGARVIGCYENHIGPYLGKVRLEHLTTATFSDLLHTVRQKSATATTSGGHARTVGVVLALLKQIYKWGNSTGQLERNPVAALDAQALGASKGEVGERVLSRDELKLLVHILEFSEMEPKWRHLTWLMLSCATRVGETTMAEVSHFDLTKMVWFIPKENQKKRRKVVARDHFVNISPFALQHVQTLIEIAKMRKIDAKKAGTDTPNTGTFMFPSRLIAGGESHADLKTFPHQLSDRQTETPNSTRTQTSTELILPGGPWGSHDLRRTAGTLMRNNKVDKDIVDACLNHVVGTQSQRIYQKPEMLDAMKLAWETLGTILEQLTAEANSDSKTNNFFRQKSIQRATKKKLAQAEKMKLTKARNKLIFDGLSVPVSPTK